MNENIVIIKPNIKDQYGELKDFSAIEPPLWHAILADAYHAVAIIDAEAENYSCQDTLIATLFYEPNKVIILASGNHPSAFIQTREGMNKLIKMLEPYTTIETIGLENLPFSPVKYKPRWDLLDMTKYKAHLWHSFTNNCETQPYGITYTSISCPMQCQYCATKSFYGKTFEQRLIEDVMSDFDSLAKKGITNIKIMDELFIFNKKRVHAICDEIIKRGYNFNIWAYARIDIMDNDLLSKMRKAGIRWLAFGIEHGNENIRKNVLKGSFTNQQIKNVIKMTKDNDICIIGNFMFGFWEDTMDTLKETYNLALELQCEYINFYNLCVYPGTPLYEKYQKKGISLYKNYNQYAQTSSVFKPLPTYYLEAEEVLKYRDEAFINYFKNPSYLNMIKDKFGELALKKIDEMLSIKLERQTLCLQKK